MSILTLDRTALRDDVARRVLAIQRLMKERDLKLILAVSSGAPSQTGWIRYLTGADLWSGQAYIIVERDHPEPIIVLWSNYLAEWISSMATTTRIESTLERRIAPISRVLEIVTDLTGGTGRIGTLNFNRSVLVGDYHAFAKAFPRLELVDATDQANLIRQIKSPFEIEAMRETGRTLVEGFRIFEEQARPGRRALEISGMIEGFLRGKGYNWGRAKYSLDQRPYTLPVDPARTLRDDDVILFQYVFQSSLGYWYEVARLYSFAPLSKETERRYAAMDQAMHQIAKMCRPGATYGMISEASDRIFRDHGLSVVGKHTEDVHSIGTDISDGPPWYKSEWELQENMVVALHPASLVEGDLAFFICENYVITPAGAEPLSPLQSFYRQLPAS